MSKSEAIKRAVDSMSWGNKLMGRREIKELPQILRDDELPEKIIQGFYKNGAGILVATTERLIFIDKGIFSSRVEDFPYERIVSIQHSTGMMGGQIDIFANGNNATIEKLPNKGTKEFADHVRLKISKTGEESPTPVDVVSQLERLAQLKEKGILSDSEFEAQKTNLLNS